tara:strand:- start:1717 stop:1833 length:117 start_codon:yes stop_codon:yes gene_type:complete
MYGLIGLFHLARRLEMIEGCDLAESAGYDGAGRRALEP